MVIVGCPVESYTRHMNKQTITTNPPLADSQDRGEQVSIIKASVIKLGIDVHQRQYVVVRQVDQATPQPAQRFTPEEFFRWVVKQQLLGEKVYACYEAGPFGYGLQRQLEVMGIQCYVICPQDWDERGQKVKNDSRDARAMVLRLDRYVQGNLEALAVVRVPTAGEEQDRVFSRQREQFAREKRRLEAQGRSLMASQGIFIGGHWWKKQNWEKHQKQLPEWIIERLEAWRAILLLIEEKLQALTQELQKACTVNLPRGFGALTFQMLQREIADWHRFRNRRQVASYTGMCPGQNSSGLRRQGLSITKHGNPRVRHLLIELAWRLLIFQPAYPPICKWRHVWANPKATSSARKKAIVAVGRRLAVDLWRMNTGRCTAADLHLV